MPFESKSQQKLFFAKEAREELPQGTARRWAHETKDIQRLPEKKQKARKRKRKQTRKGRR